MGTLAEHILNRLASTKAGDETALLVLAALEGDTALTAYLAGSSTPGKPAAPAPAPTGPVVEPPGAFVGAITVGGFRGVGPSCTLPLQAGPGLTLVVGRNGSGKSSFAEGLELLLTGENSRWKGRSKAWGVGWRNLHQGDATSIAVDMVVEGREPLTVSRAWPAGADVTGGAPVVGAKGKPEAPLASLGWTQHLSTFRPFLSYNELTSILDEKPSDAYDALSRALGLDEFVVVQDRLASARRPFDELVKTAKGGATAMAIEAERIGTVSAEPRVERLATLLKAKKWDFAALQALVSGASDTTQQALDALRRLTALRAPGTDAAQQAVIHLRSAATALDALRGTDAARSLARARLLEQALAFHARHSDRGGVSASTCPVCGTTDALSSDWLAASTTEVAALKAEATAVQDAERSLATAVSEARAFIHSVGALPSAQAGEVAGLQALRDADGRWLSGRTLDQPMALVDHIESHLLELAEATAQVAAGAAEELTRREDVWRPLSERLAQWLPHAQLSVTGKARVDELKAAEQWWKEATEAIRDERFAPIADRAIAIWKQLRLQSNVDLGEVTLGGSATRRHVALKVTVDGTDAEALGVMSQGELHSLALSLFLPRAMLPDSPFRFICVDDPVQSMDPARVEGLARVLHETAKTRQVIVFSHDDRLTESVRHLGLPARILRVTRRANSVVDVQEARDPVSGYLEDARAVLKTDDLRADVKARVVPGFCRMALEAACVTTIRSRRLRAGEPHQAVDDLLAEHVKLYPLMSLALFDDATRQSDVLARLRKLADRAPESFKACNLGAHESHDGDLEGLVYDTGKLAAAVLRGGQ